MKSEAEINAELTNRFEQLTPEKKDLFIQFMLDMLEVENPDYNEFDENGNLKVAYCPAEMIIPAK